MSFKYLVSKFIMGDILFDSLKDKLALVTGGEMGIGKSIAKKFVQAGARVAIVGIDNESGRETADELGSKVKFYSADVSKEKEVKDLPQKVEKKQGKVDIVVNNAGILREGDVETTSYEDWQKVLKVNLDGVFLISKYFITEHLKSKEKSVIVNIGSEAGIDAFKNQVAYNVSKAGVIHLTKSIAVDFAEEGIRANVICPGTTYTPMVEKAIERADDPEVKREEFESIRPLRRLGDPEEIATAVLSLASNELGYATGSVLSIDGGSTAE